MLYYFEIFCRLAKNWQEMTYIQQEITPIGDEDLFIVLDHPSADFDYATHYHSDYEITMVTNEKGKRIISDSVYEYGEIDLVMIGPNIPHRWTSDKADRKAHVVTIQFHREVFEYPIINKKLFYPIRDLLSRSALGIEFSRETIDSIKNDIYALSSKHGIDSALSFFKILYKLSICEGQKAILANQNIELTMRQSKSRRINRIMEYVDKNFSHEITLSTVSQLIGMSESAFSHFFKKRTNRGFIDYLNDIRVGHAAMMLYETTHSIAEICYASGFNNISNFNRTFKAKKGHTPSEYRKNIQQILTKF